MYKILVSSLAMTLALGSVSQLTIVTPALADKHKIDETCNNVNQQFDSGRFEHCEAAKTQAKASGNQKIVGATWAAVSAVCIASCIPPLAAAGGSKICMAAGIGGAVSEVVIGKKFQQGLMSAATWGGAQYALGKVSLKGLTGQKLQCLGGAIFAGMTAAKRFKSASENSKGVQESLEKAKKSDGDVALPNNGQGNGPGAVGGRTQGNNYNFAGNTGGDAKTSSSSDPCSQGYANKDAKTVLSCALSEDPSLQEFANMPEVEKELEQVLNSNLDSELSSSSGQPLASSLGSALGDHYSSEQLAKIRDAAAKMEKEVMGGVEGSAYAGGRGGSGADGGANGELGDDEFQKMMAAMMNRGNGDGQGGKDGAVDGELNFGVAQRGLASASEGDRRKSLFERVTHRYHFLGKRMIEENSARPTSGHSPNHPF